MNKVTLCSFGCVILIWPLISHFWKKTKFWIVPVKLDRGCTLIMYSKKSVIVYSFRTTIQSFSHNVPIWPWTESHIQKLMRPTFYAQEPFENFGPDLTVDVLCQPINLNQNIIWGLGNPSVTEAYNNQLTSPVANMHQYLTLLEIPHMIVFSVNWFDYWTVWAIHCKLYVRYQQVKCENEFNQYLWRTDECSSAAQQRWPLNVKAF